MEFRDYYKILGVERAATAEQIKAAYRRLARKYHPDVSKEPNAEARFKEMQEAYEVRANPQKRPAYDQLGSEWKSGQQFRPPPDWAPQGARGRRRAAPGGGAGAGAQDGSFTQEEFSDFFSSLFGGGSEFGGAAARAGRDQHARLDIELEEAYRGTTRTLELKRPEVKPDGSLELRAHTVRVTIPAGVSEGQLIRLAGQGEADQGGAGAGDLYLEVHLLPHRRFRHRANSRRRGGDAHSPRRAVGPEAAPARARTARVNPRGPVRAAQGGTAAGRFPRGESALRRDACEAQLRSACP